MMSRSVSGAKVVKSACALCVACCGIVLHVKDGKLEPGSDGALALSLINVIVSDSSCESVHPGNGVKLTSYD